MVVRQGGNGCLGAKGGRRRGRGCSGVVFFLIKPFNFLALCDLLQINVSVKKHWFFFTYVVL